MARSCECGNDDFSLLGSRQTSRTERTLAIHEGLGSRELGESEPRGDYGSRACVTPTNQPVTSLTPTRYASHLMVHTGIYETLRARDESQHTLSSIHHPLVHIKTRTLVQHYIVLHAIWRRYTDWHIGTASKIHTPSHTQ